MSLILKFKQHKEDGWHYDFEVSDLNVTAIRYEDFWNNIMLCVVNDSEVQEKLYSGKHKLIKEAIEKHLLQLVETIKEELYEDLNNFVKIYPLIKRKEVT